MICQARVDGLFAWRIPVNATRKGVKTNKMRMTKRYRGLLARYKVLPLLLIIGAVFTMTCDRIIFDSLDNCERGVYLHLYEQTECASTPSYPADITALTIFVFDADNRLISMQELGATTLAPDHELFVRLPEPGSYTVVAWASR